MTTPTTHAKTSVPERYLKALDGADPLQVLRKSPKRLRKLIKSAKGKELGWKADAATWSVHEVIGHMADHEFVFGARVRFVAAQDKPPLPAYDENLFLARLGVDRSRLEDLFDAWVAARAANVHLLDRLPEDAWSRTGIHQERGELSLTQIVLTNAGHDRIHEEQIERVIARARVARRELKERERAADKAVDVAKKAAKKAGAKGTNGAASAAKTSEKDAARQVRKDAAKQDRKDAAKQDRKDAAKQARKEAKKNASAEPSKRNQAATAS